MKLKIMFLILLALFSNVDMFGQQNNYLYELEKKIMLGKKEGLTEIAPYFDSKKEVTEFLGYHIIKTTESLVAKRIVGENCIFLNDEILLSDTLTAKGFQTFLNKNSENIFFSDYAQAFFVTPLEKRKIRFDIRKISNLKTNELKQKEAVLLNLDWVKANGIDVLIKEKNPKTLLLIASDLYKNRYRFNRYSVDKSQYTDLIKLITGTEIAVENEKNNLTWFVEEEFYPNASLNLLIYFLNNYKDYKWNAKEQIFENRKEYPNQLDKEELFFEMLNSKNDSIAKDAFTQLTNCRVEKVITIAKEYDRSNKKVNYSLPTFPFRFLNQLVLLNEYCKKNNIDLNSSEKLILDFKKLESKLSFSVRRQLEDKLIENLTLDQITAFEYYALLNEKSWELTYSSGRILDVFYSKNWNNLIDNEKHLKVYLKKAFLFQNLGIIGICNNYIKKFQNADEHTIAQLNLLHTTDSDIKLQTENAKKTALISLKKPNVIKKESDVNKDFEVSNLKSAFLNLKDNGIEEYEDEVTDLLSKISYNQIEEALELIEDVQFKTKWKNKYSFINDDFGFFWIKNFDDENEREEFIKSYNRYSEYDFYAYYLNRSAIDYLNEDNSLNYDKIYELLKYDVVTAFVGGGGGKKNNETYALIKLLEIKHKTTLGYPKKLCNSKRIYACYADGRVNEWIKFIIDNKLLKLQHNQPVSFSYESN